MRARSRPLFLLVALAVSPVASNAAGQAAARPQPLVSTRSTIASGLILAATLLGDHGLRFEILERRNGATGFAARLGNALGDPKYVLPTLGAGFLAGRLFDNPSLSGTAERAGKAVALAGGVTTVLKLAVGRRRPAGDGDADEFHPFSGWNSFPSGHTAVAFALATAIADETDDGWSDAALYGAATLTAFARVTDDRHWTSDVFVGALVGHLSGRWLALRRGEIMVRPGAIGIALEF